MKSISLIIAAYELTLAPILKSIGRQHRAPSFEVLICADGSSSAIVNEALQLASTLNIDARLVWQPDIGFRLSRSRNNGIRCSQGEILVFVDADACLPPHFLLQHFEAHIRRNRLAFGLIQKINLPAGLLDSIQEVFAKRPDRSKDELLQLNWLQSDWPWMACGGCNLSIRRGPDIYWDEEFEGYGGEDREYVLRQTYRNGCELYFAQELSLIHFDLLPPVSTKNPFKSGRSEDIVNWLSSRVKLHQRFPLEVIRPCIRLASQCYLDESGQWVLKQNAAGRSPESVLVQFAEWQNARHREPSV